MPYVLFFLCPKNNTSFIYSIQPGTYNYPWSNTDGLLSKINRGTEIVQGDHICFLSSIIKCLEVDHEIKLNIQEVKDLVVEQALEFHEKYVEFHASPLKVIPHYMSTSDNFVGKILDFFSEWPICQRYSRQCHPSSCRCIGPKCVHLSR